MPVAGRYTVKRTAFTATGGFDQVCSENPARTVLIIAPNITASSGWEVSLSPSTNMNEGMYRENEWVEITYHKHGDLVQMAWYASAGLAAIITVIEIIETPGYCPETRIGD